VRIRAPVSGASLRARAPLTVVYQPKVDPRTGIVLGAEALSRWRHGGQSVPPDEFIPLAERCGIIRPLTRHVLDTALADCSSWRRAGHAISASPTSRSTR
jgi:EAL domain-containing protein (putative c-di-GMP-specific phosphodiesterase class I)